HPGFEAEEDGITWYGDEVPEATRRHMLERAREGGLELAALPDGPQRWVRGSVQEEGAELWVQVNSRGRLQRLLGLLAELGHPARVAEERVSDVAEKLSRRVDEAPDLWSRRGRAPSGWACRPTSRSRCSTG